MENFEEKTENVFITKANYMRMLTKFDLTKLPILNGEPYKKPIYFFSKWEKNHLLAIKSLLQDPENFVTLYYNKVIKEDTYTYVYEGGIPAYHTSKQCEKLTSTYKNFAIPDEIKERGVEEVKRFRLWFQGYKHYLDENPEKFADYLEANFFIRINIASIEQGNSGAIEVKNYDLEELENTIDSLIKEAGRYYYRDEKTTKILKVFSQLTFLAKKHEPLEKNETGYSDDEVKELLKDYEEKFKKPLKSLLPEYYKVIYNPELSFKGELLIKLGFKECGLCRNNISFEELFELDNKLKGDININT